MSQTKCPSGHDRSSSVDPILSIFFLFLLRIQSIIISLSNNKIWEEGRFRVLELMAYHLLLPPSKNHSAVASSFPSIPTLWINYPLIFRPVAQHCLHSPCSFYCFLFWIRIFKNHLAPPQFSAYDSPCKT